MVSFKKASKAQARLRMAIIGPSGGGKTYTALAIASALGSRIAVLDTERGSASKYADKFAFEVAELETFEPSSYVSAIQAAGAAGYDVLVIDSLSHAWMGKGGALEQVDNAAKRSQGNKFAAWRDVTPMHNALVDAILRSPMHVIVTMRTKTEYVLETNERGKQVPRKIGTQPIQRDGMEYEFDVVADVEQENHDLIIGKTRCSALDGKVFRKAGADVAKILSDWLTDGVEPPPAPAPPPPPASAPVAKASGATTATVELTIAAMLNNATDIGHVAAADKAAIQAKRDGALTTAALNRLRDARTAAVGRLSAAPQVAS